MHPLTPLPVTGRLSTACIGACAAFALAASASAADDDLRIVPQLNVGTAGLEPGAAVEWRAPALENWTLRPEVLISEDVRLGAALAALYDISEDFSLPKDQSFGIGPRLVYHNADDTGWEGDVMGEWAFSLSDAPKSFRHAVGLVGTLGIRQDRSGHDDKLGLGASIGGFYSFRF
jgi:hypothetical protein